MRLSTRSTDQVFEMIKTRPLRMQKGRDRESNPGLSYPKREFYHLTIPSLLVRVNSVASYLCFIYAVRGKFQRDNV